MHFPLHYSLFVCNLYEKKVIIPNAHRKIMILYAESKGRKNTHMHFSIVE